MAVKDEAREALLADNSVSETSDDEKVPSPSKGKKKVKTKSVEEGKGNNKGRKELLADNSSADEGSKISEKIKEKTAKDKEALLADADENSEEAKGRKELLAGNSSEDENESEKSSPQKNASQIKTDKDREALLADNSDIEVDNSNLIKTEQGKNEKGRKELLQDDSSNDSDNDDKENRGKKQVNGEVKRTKVKVSSKERMEEQTEASDEDESENNIGFVVLGEYNADTNEISKLDDDILVQLDGAGMLFFLTYVFLRCNIIWCPVVGIESLCIEEK